LDRQQTDIAVHFSTPPEERGAIDAKNITTLLETPVIANAIAAMNCRVTSANQAGDHTVFIGEVNAIKVGSGDLLVWFQRQFGGFSTQGMI
jgi:flavin reductase (DIM6/NTAB) family NADH-FMN oxidoreductase RutF